tara:strand:- start:2064 stop:3302 length:1239 start_codon:yes stop_codon:yes gene_type:complete
MNTLLLHKNPKLSINIISGFLVLALLRLLPFNFYASMIVGHEVIIDNREGNAINFVNYISVFFLIFVALIKLPTIRAKWQELWPFGVLMLIYLANLFFAPYVKASWVIYQLAFILIACVIHILLSGQSGLNYEKTLKSGGFMFFISVTILFLGVVFSIMYSEYSVSYIISEFNDSFINSANSIGLMKQYYGYVVGFIVLYALFVLDKIWIKIAVVALAFFTAFGIRSFIIGIVGVLFFLNLKSPVRLLVLIIIMAFAAYFLWDDIIMEMLYDTRFYAYMNGWDIIQKFPFGVGLGGYPEYTEINNSVLFATFFTIDAALNYVPNSPESDLVHVFGSLGLWAGIIHIFIQMRLIFLGLAHRFKMRPFEKCMFYFFIFMTAFGISEDTMFTVSYWIFFGVTSGIIASISKRKYA